MQAEEQYLSKSFEPQNAFIFSNNAAKRHQKSMKQRAHTFQSQKGKPRPSPDGADLNKNLQKKKRSNFETLTQHQTYFQPINANADERNKTREGL